MSVERPDIVMLTGTGLSSRAMYHALAGQCNVLTVIQECKPSRKTMLLRRIRKLGLYRVVGQLLFMLYDHLSLQPRQQARVDELIVRYQLDTGDIPPDVVQCVASINSPQVIAMLAQYQPDAIVVNGTRIISSDVLSCNDAPFLNTHAGITPRYRGVHGGYWALARGDRQHCGVTVHLIDAGIDTGAVLYQARIEADKSDGFNTYPIHQIARAIPLMKQALRDAAAHQLQPVHPAGPSTLWSHPTLFEYLRNRQALGVE